jgi:hypothetical protein
MMMSGVGMQVLGIVFVWKCLRLWGLRHNVEHSLVVTSCYATHLGKCYYDTIFQGIGQHTCSNQRLILLVKT